MNFRSGLVGKLVFLSLPFLSVACGGGDDGDDAPADGTAHTYLLAMDENDFSEPRGVAQDIAPYVPEFVFRTENSSTFKIGTAEGGTQNLCNKTVDVSLSGGVLGPVDFPLRIVQRKEDTDQPADVIVDATVYDMTFKNILPSGSTVSTTGEFTGSFDARQLYPLFYLLVTPTPDAVCMALADANAPCVPCRDGQSYCLGMKAERIGATETGGTVQSVDSIPATCN